MYSGGFNIVVVAAYVFVLVAAIVLVVAVIRLVLHATTVLKLSAEERRIRIELLRIKADTEIGGPDPSV